MKMKKNYSILLGAAVLFSSSIASAQQLPNVGFESWKSSSGSTEAFTTSWGSIKYEMRVRPGVEPTDWNGSSVNQKVGLTVSKELIFKETSDVASGSSAVKMQNIFVGLGSMGSVAPGFLTFGTPWVYVSTTVSDCDGGTYGGVSFTHKPDAITGKYKRTDSNDENSYIIAYLWNGTYSSKVGKKGSPTQSRNDEVRAIFGKVTPDASGQLVAKCEYAFKSTNGAWQEITVPFEYVAGASAPTKMNVIISGGNYWDRGALVENTTLLADDVKFVYYSRLSALSVNGVAVEGFSSDVYNYSIASTELPAVDQISATVMGQTATKSIAIDEEAATVTITVSNVDADIDGQSSHTYVLQYEKAKVGVTTEYPGYLNVNIYDAETDDWGSVAENENKSITITEYEDGTCDFLLPQLYLASLGMELGDILVEGATVTKAEDGTATYSGFVKDMPLLGGELIADVTLNGTISAESVVDMKIDVLWMGIPIECTFTTNIKMPETIYAIVNKSGESLELSTAVELEKNPDCEDVFSGEVTFENDGDGFSYFILASDVTDMDVVNTRCYAPKTDASFAIDENVDFTKGDGSVVFKVAAEGKYFINVDFVNNVVNVSGFATGVEGIEVDNVVKAVYYNLQGVKVANPENGVFIKVQGSKASKVIVK